MPLPRGLRSVPCIPRQPCPAAQPFSSSSSTAHDHARAPSAEAVAGLIAAFVAANHPAATPQSARHAVDQLLQASFGLAGRWAGSAALPGAARLLQALPLPPACFDRSTVGRAATLACPGHQPTLQATTASFDLLSPYCEASGRGSPAAALAAPHAPAAPSSAAYSFGGEREAQTAPDRAGHAHPGELAAAEAFARAAQRRMLAAGLPAGADAGSVRVAVTVHQQLGTFIYSQPTAFQAETPQGARRWAAACRMHLLLAGARLRAPAPPRPRRAAHAGSWAHQGGARSGRQPQAASARPAHLPTCLPGHAAPPSAGAEWVVHCHVHLHWEHYQVSHGGLATRQGG